MEGRLSRRWLLALIAVLACTAREVDSGTGLPRTDSWAAPAGHLEDTSTTGEVTTAFVQPPAARDTQGLLDQEESPRVILRCLDGKIEASIYTGVGDTIESLLVPIELDSAPTCE